MNYNSDMKKAARRNFQAAEELLNTHRKDVAGYLYGLAAECAIKAAMSKSGMRPLAPTERRNDPFYAHFETLKTLLRDTTSGRRGTELRLYSENSAFMQHWDTSMRYSDGKAIQDKWIVRWRNDAVQAIAIMDN